MTESWSMSTNQDVMPSSFDKKNCGNYKLVLATQNINGYRLVSLVTQGFITVSNNIDPF